VPGVWRTPIFRPPPQPVRHAGVRVLFGPSAALSVSNPGQSSHPELVNCHHEEGATMKEEEVVLIVEDDDGHARLIERNLRRACINNEMLRFADWRQILDFLF
jgi:hypothetical protein